jgi:Predicted ATPase
MFTSDRKLYVAHGPSGRICINGKMANRHGLIAGATGTGKTVSLQVLAETFSQAGIPCFMADMKGDLSGISQAGSMNGFIEKRCAEFGIESPKFENCPVRFFDIYGEQGHPIRAKISSMGPTLLSRLMNLNETQEGILNIVFRIADDNGLLLIDIKDLRSMLDYVAKNANAFRSKYGNITTQSVGTIQRSLLGLEDQGADKFFGEPEFDIFDFIQTENGKGIMNVLAADKLMLNPKLYSTFLLWLMSELYAQLPEVGDQELPKFVFFFDEAHMLFDDTPKALVDKIEQVIRLIRSKGVGIYFITQSPSDIPDSILAQLGNRVQHALRAFTPRDQKVVKAAAETFRANPAFKTEDAIMELATGEALVSFLDEKGSPSIVERAKILFPLSQIGAINVSQRDSIIKSSRLYGRYERMIDRESAFEVLKAEQEKILENAQAEEENNKQQKRSGKGKGLLGVLIGAVATSFARSLGTSAARSITRGSSSRSRTSKGALSGIGKTVASTAARNITTTLTRSILGNLLK